MFCRVSRGSLLPPPTNVQRVFFLLLKVFYDIASKINGLDIYFSKMYRDILNILYIILKLKIFNKDSELSELPLSVLISIQQKTVIILINHPHFSLYKKNAFFLENSMIPITANF